MKRKKMKINARGHYNFSKKILERISLLTQYWGELYRVLAKSRHRVSARQERCKVSAAAGALPIAKLRQY